MSIRPRSSQSWFAALVGALLSATFVLAGCGGASSLTITHKAVQTPIQSGADVSAGVSGTAAGVRSLGRVTGGRGHHGSSIVTSGQPTYRARGGAPATSEGNLPGVRAQNPCALLSAQEAQNSAGAPITWRTEAPLGPTCIYQLGGSKASITLTVESTSFAALAKQMKKPARITVAGRPAVCGSVGREMLFVSLSSGKVLNVTAPCSVATRFAATAIGRIKP